MASPLDRSYVTANFEKKVVPTWSSQVDFHSQAQSYMIHHNSTAAMIVTPYTTH